MTTSLIRFALTETAVAARSLSRIASEPDAPHTALERRWQEIGGMLEPLARRLDAWRLVRALEAHKDALRRQMDA